MQQLSEGFFLTSELAATYARELEEIFYFNPNQGRVYDSVQKAVEQFGYPRIATEDGKIRLEFDSLYQAQSLYLFRNGTKPDLAGVVVYSLETERIRLLYIALKPHYTYNSGTNESSKYLLLEVVSALIKSARAIKGVRVIEFLTNSGWRTIRSA